MTATITPAADRAARLLVQAHGCVDCRALPVRPFDPADVEDGVQYRPKTPRPIAGGGPRSPRCTTHKRAKKRADSLRQRTADKATRYGVPRAVQVALWAFQGHQCPCGRKRSVEIPAGVTLDHVHTAPCILRGDHPENRGCLECVTQFVCSHCNREIIGRLEGAFRGDRDRVALALFNLATAVASPALARLLAERPDLRTESAA
jgi:hypothetical protein